MNLFEQALAADRDERLAEAIDLYHAALGADGPAEALKSTYVRLAAIYYGCADYGVTAHYGLDERYLMTGRFPRLGVLAVAMNRFGRCDSAVFWHEFTDSSLCREDLTGEYFPDRWKRAAKGFPDSDLIGFGAMMYGAIPPDGDVVRRLRNQVQNRHTREERELFSYLNGLAAKHLLGESRL